MLVRIISNQLFSYTYKNPQANSENGAQESVTSRDFDQFLAERAAAAESLPNAGENKGQTPQQTPRHRQIKKEDPDSMFAL